MPIVVVCSLGRAAFQCEVALRAQVNDGTGIDAALWAEHLLTFSAAISNREASAIARQGDVADVSALPGSFPQSHLATNVLVKADFNHVQRRPLSSVLWAADCHSRVTGRKRS